MKGKTQRPANFDKAFYDLKERPVILNHLPAETIKDREAIDSLVYTEYTKDVNSLDGAPTCSCGTTNTQLGDLCPFCNTRVEYQHMRTIQPSVWIESPECVETLFTPFAWESFHSALSAGKWSGLDYYTNTMYRKPDPSHSKALDIVRRGEKFGLERGYNNIVRNYDTLVEFAAHLIHLKGGNNSRIKAERFQRLFMEYKHLFLCHHLPLPSKIAFVLDKSSLSDWTDGAFKHAMECVRTISGLEREATDERRIANRISAMQTSLMELNKETTGESFGRKPGWLRQTTFGSRINHSWRTVITSKAGVHHYEEIDIPYSQACVIFKVHLMNRLVHLHAMSLRQAHEYIESHTAEIDPFLMGELRALIKSTPKAEGYWATFTRYPTLSRGSTQAFRIVDFSERGSRLSPMTIKQQNADFDGDNQSGGLCNSLKDAKAIETLRPHYGIHDYSKPFSINNAMVLPDVTVGVISNWVEKEDQYLNL